MGRKKDQNSLGRSLIKERFKKTKKQADTFLHTADLDDGYNWGRLNLTSITEQSNLADFLSTAELAGAEYIAEKMNVMVVDSSQENKVDLQEIYELQLKNKERLCIPRRPAWTKDTTPEELDRMEREMFLCWRRDLSRLQEEKGLILTPYERNIEFWRQLWRVIERSHVVVQIVDARNPMLFYCRDLEKYIKEVDRSKVSLILVNKADYLTEEQRMMWRNYFKSQNILSVFWSALNESQAHSEPPVKPDQVNSNGEFVDDVNQRASCDSSSNESNIVKRKYDILNYEDSSSSSSESTADEDGQDIDDDSDNNVDDNDNDYDRVGEGLNANLHKPHSEDGIKNEPIRTESTTQNSIDIESHVPSETCTSTLSTISEHNTDIDSDLGRICSSCDLLSVNQLLQLFRILSRPTENKMQASVIGMVGYPNVGKSSTINAILHRKKVPVSVTPGRTKHFQTLYVDDDLILCDCPGLVFPSFVTTKAELVVNGILPIDQMRDHLPPIELVCERIPVCILSNIYGVMLPVSSETEKMRSPSALELLNSYASMRGFMTHKGLPDCPRASRHILKDYVKGRLLFCTPPPEVDYMLFKPTIRCFTKDNRNCKNERSQDLIEKPDYVGETSSIEYELLQEESFGVHSKGAHHGIDCWRTGLTRKDLRKDTRNHVSEKPWRQKVKTTHKKREKLRRVYKHLDA